MTARAALLVAFLTAGVVVDGAWLSRLPWVWRPDVIGTLVVLSGLRYGVEAGALFGVTGGYLRDLVTGTPLGLYILVYLAMGAAAGAVSPVVDLQQRLVPGAAALWGTLAAGLLTAVVVHIVGLGPVPWLQLIPDMAVAALFNALLAGPLAALLRWTDRVTQRRYSGRTIGHRVLR